MATAETPMPGARHALDGRGSLLRYLTTGALLAAMLVLHLCLSSQLSPARQWQLLLNEPGADFEALQFHLSALPRLAVALMVGAALGLAGSLLQQMTQNRLVSPMTIGASSGAWLGLILMTLLAPALAVNHGYWGALAGALASVGLVVLIAGRNGIGGLPLVLAGMAMNLLLGSLAAGLILVRNQYLSNVFVWGAGDLAQIDWHWAHWLWPKLLIGLLVMVIAPRALTLLRLGGDGAQARGLNLWPVLMALFAGALWLTAVSVTAVGLIGFIGLLTPNLARLFGARSAVDELLYSLLLGALLLTTTDSIALLLNQTLGILVPSGATAALIGAPALLWLSRRQLTAEDQRGLSLPEGAERITAGHGLLLGGAGLAVVVVSVCLSKGLDGWHFGWPSSLTWSLRWPRVVTALAAGAGLAVAGMMLQRLLRNPLASPDILGLSAGATLAVMLSVVLFGGTTLGAIAPVAATLGTLAVLAALLVLGRRHQYSPPLMALIGIALGALINAALQYGLSQGTADSFALLGWLAGSTYRVSAAQSLWLLAGTLLLGGLSLAFSRALTLISIGEGVAASRGLDVPRMRVMLLVLVALLCALVTAMLGPVAFLGLLAPHMAAILGARRVATQLLLAAALGSVLMLAADWLGRMLIFPLQMPVGIVASVLCGSYFMLLLIRRRLA